MSRFIIRTALTLGCLACVAGPSRADEVPDPHVDEVLRGLWRCQVVSRDRGRTLEDGENFRFARVTETQVRTADGRMHSVDRILRVRIADNDPVHFLRLSDGTVWAITKRKDNPHILLRVIKDDAEQSRMIFVVER